MARYCVGDFIKETRERRGYTQEELSHGICSASSLSRIETGLQKPNSQTLDALLERIGTSNGAFTEFVSKEEADFYEQKREVQSAIIDQNYEKLKVLLDKMEKCLDSKITFEKQYYLYAKGVLLLGETQEYEKAMECYKKAIHITLPEFNGIDPLERNLLTFDEIAIINAIASVHAKEGRLKEAIALGKWLKTYMESKVVDENEKKEKYPLILCNLSNWLGKSHQYWDVIEMADCGIHFCIKTGTLHCFPNLIYNKACALAEVGELKSAEKFFAQAIVLFECIGNNKVGNQVVAMCKEEYHMDIQVSFT